MLFSLMGALFVAFPSVVLMRTVERSAERVGGGTLARWRRLLIPIPMVLFLVANLDGVFSLLAYLKTHPTAVPVRYSDNQAWNTDRFFYAGLVAAALLPLVLIGQPYKFAGFVLRVWAEQVLWMLFPFAPLLFASGVPLRG